jgi:mannose-6-phosphate isomerase-like protein (cupin superfamily)
LWGREDIIHNDHRYCGKFLHLKPNYQCSLHYHLIKHETFTAIDGTVWVEYYPIETNERIITMLRGWAHDSLTVPAGMPHRFWTTDPDGAVLAEFSTPHNDDDVVRITDSRPWPSN